MPNNSRNNRPTMCRDCGAIVGAGEPQCAVCGATVSDAAAPQPPQAAPDSETVKFARAVLGRPHKFTIIFLVANLFVFLLMWQSSGLSFSGLSSFSPTVLVSYGAKLNSLVDEQYQWWRLVMPMFVHVNLLHLMVNMYCLWVVGPYVEKLYGSAKFVVFWVLSGVVALIASYLTVVSPGRQSGFLGRFLFKLEDVPSAGASGALFGLVGVLFVFGIKFRRELPEGFKRAFGTGLLPMIALNLFIGYVGRGFIDNAAHLGGFVAGAVLALVVNYRRPGERTGVAITWGVLQIACLTLLALSFIKTAQHFKDPPPQSVLDLMARLDSGSRIVDNDTARFVTYAKAMNEGQEAFNLALNRRDLTSLDGAIKSLESAPQLDPKADELRENLQTLLSKTRSLEHPATTGQGNLNVQAEKQLITEFISWSKDYREWLKTSGKNYGLVEATERE